MNRMGCWTEDEDGWGRILLLSHADTVPRMKRRVEMVKVSGEGPREDDEANTHCRDYLWWDCVTSAGTEGYD